MNLTVTRAFSIGLAVGLGLCCSQSNSQADTGAAGQDPVALTSASPSDSAPAPASVNAPASATTAIGAPSSNIQPMGVSSPAVPTSSGLPALKVTHISVSTRPTVHAHASNGKPASRGAGSGAASSNPGSANSAGAGTTASATGQLGGAEKAKADARTGLVDTSLFGNPTPPSPQVNPGPGHVDQHPNTIGNSPLPPGSVKPNAAAMSGVFPVVRDASGNVREPAPAEIPPAVSNVANTIKNFHVVSPALFRGAQPDEAGFQALKQAGVVTVVNLRNEPQEVKQEKEITQKLGMKYLDIPMAVFNPLTDKEINEFLSTVEKSKGPVYVHCQFGQDRTGTMCAMYRIHAMGWSGDQAIPEMLKYGFKPELLNYMNAVVTHSHHLGRPATPPDEDFLLKDVKQRIGKVLDKSKKK